MWIRWIRIQNTGDRPVCTQVGGDRAAPGEQCGEPGEPGEHGAGGDGGAATRPQDPHQTHAAHPL